MKRCEAEIKILLVLNGLRNRILLENLKQLYAQSSPFQIKPRSQNSFAKIMHNAFVLWCENKIRTRSSEMTEIYDLLSTCDSIVCFWSGWLRTYRRPINMSPNMGGDLCTPVPLYNCCLCVFSRVFLVQLFHWTHRKRTNRIITAAFKLIIGKPSVRTRLCQKPDDSELVPDSHCSHDQS